MEIAVLGLGNAGKSSFVHVINVSQKPTELSEGGEQRASVKSLKSRMQRVEHKPRVYALLFLTNPVNVLVSSSFVFSFSSFFSLFRLVPSKRT